MKLLRYYFLNRIVKDPMLSAQVYHMIYHKGVPPKVEYKLPTYEPSKVTEVKSVPSQKVSDVRSALLELKSKSIKTKQDRESISMLEAALKNGY